MSRRITLCCNYIKDYSKEGYYNLELSEEDYGEFKSLSKEEQIKWIKDCGDFIVTSFKVEDSKKEDNFEVLSIK